MTTVRDPARGVHTSVLPCRSCDKPVYFSLTPTGKRAPFDLDSEGNPTRISHFTTCPNASQWSKKR